MAERHSFVLQGLTPFLFHADDIEAADELKEWRGDPDNENLSVKGDDRSPPWTWMTYLYYDDEGNVALPEINLMVALRNAGAKMILKGSKTYKEITQSGIAVESQFCEFLTSGKRVTRAAVEALRDLTFKEQNEGAQALGFTKLWPKRAPIKRGGAKHVRVRPYCAVWEVHGTVAVNKPEEITPAKLEELFRFAGEGGLGDWRPSGRTPGRFGQFAAKLKRLK